jgi:hypothetical protein
MRALRVSLWRSQLRRRRALSVERGTFLEREIWFADRT